MLLLLLFQVGVSWLFVVCEYHINNSSSLCVRSADLYQGEEEIQLGASRDKPSKAVLELTSINNLLVWITVYISYYNLTDWMH